jgi:hypothetical protein
MFGMVYISDLVQRISRQRQHKTRIENMFKGWSRLLINTLLVFAIEHGVQSFFSPTAALAGAGRGPPGRLVAYRRPTEPAPRYSS